MSLWLDFLGAEIRLVTTPSFGRVRIAEAGRGNGPPVLLMHGIGGHLEAYAKNVVALSEHFHVVAFDFAGHGRSDMRIDAFNPLILAEQALELLDELGIPAAHVSGESLGGWVAGQFAARYPRRTLSLLLNTAAGIPIVSEQGHKDLQDLITLSARNAQQEPTMESVTARMRWLMHESNWGLLSDELVRTRLTLYRQPEVKAAAALIGRFLASGGQEYLLPLENIATRTLFLWTRHNPIHDVAAAEAAQARMINARLYVMQAEACHWPQYEAPAEFNRVAADFFLGR